MTLQVSHRHMLTIRNNLKRRRKNVNINGEIMLINIQKTSLATSTITRRTIFVPPPKLYVHKHSFHLHLNPRPRKIDRFEERTFPEKVTEEEKVIIGCFDAETTTLPRRSKKSTDPNPQCCGIRSETSRRQQSTCPKAKARTTSQGTKCAAY